MLRSAVERKLTIIGEALFQAEKADPTLTNRITDLRKIIDFRHVLIHGYGEIKDERVWGIIREKLPKLHQETKLLMEEERDPNGS